MTAHVIFDVDGVLAPYSKPYYPIPEGYEEVDYWDDENLKNLILRLNFSHTGFIEEVMSFAEPIWGSGWGEKANDILKLLHVDSKWDWIPLSYTDVGLGTWKIKPVRKWVESYPATDKVVWVDDDLDTDAFEWADERGNMLIIRTQQGVGLTLEHQQQILDFIKN